MKPGTVEARRAGKSLARQGHEASTAKKAAQKAAQKVAQKDALPGSAEAAEVEQAAPSPAKQAASRLAQIVNLHIAGYSLEDIGQAIGATAAEVDRMLQQDAARYVKSQPQLRVYTRNWLSERYTALLDAVWDDATDKQSPRRFEAQDRAMRTLDSMRKLHGADAPVQTEVKVETAPEAVEALVDALAKAQGVGYDTDIFDVVEAEVVHEAAVSAAEQTVVSGNEIDEAADAATGTDEEEGL